MESLPEGYRPKLFRDIIAEEMARKGVKIKRLAIMSNFDEGGMWRLLKDPNRWDCKLSTALKLMRALEIPMSRLEEIDL